MNEQKIANNENEYVEDVIDMDKMMVVDEKKVEVSTEIKRQVYGMKELMEMATFLSKSTIVPSQYMNRPENCYLALDIASRMDLSPIMIMQNLHVINGKPSFSGNFVGALIRTNPRFRNVKLNYVGTVGTMEYGAYVTAENAITGELIEGSKVTMGIATKEGWVNKPGSKWQTMPQQMLAYRAYAWFGRVHTPELLMGLQTSEEIYDVIENERIPVANPYESVEEKMRKELAMNPYEGTE